MVNSKFFQSSYQQAYVKYLFNWYVESSKKLQCSPETARNQPQRYHYTPCWSCYWITNVWRWQSDCLSATNTAVAVILITPSSVGKSFNRTLSSSDRWATFRLPCVRNTYSSFKVETILVSAVTPSNWKSAGFDVVIDVESYSEISQTGYLLENLPIYSRLNLELIKACLWGFMQRKVDGVSAGCGPHMYFSKIFWHSIWKH